MPAFEAAPVTSRERYLLREKRKTRLPSRRFLGSPIAISPAYSWDCFWALRAGPSACASVFSPGPSCSVSSQRLLGKRISSWSGHRGAQTEAAGAVSPPVIYPQEVRRFHVGGSDEWIPAKPPFALNPILSLCDLWRLLRIIFKPASEHITLPFRGAGRSLACRRVLMVQLVPLSLHSAGDV